MNNTIKGDIFYVTSEHKSKVLKRKACVLSLYKAEIDDFHEKIENGLKRIRKIAEKVIIKVLREQGLLDNRKYFIDAKFEIKDLQINKSNLELEKIELYYQIIIKQPYKEETNEAIESEDQCWLWKEVTKVTKVTGNIGWKDGFNSSNKRTSTVYTSDSFLVTLEQVQCTH